MALKSPYQLFAFKEISDVEVRPGLYAWYLKMHLTENNISSAENILEALRRLSSESRYPDLEIQLVGHLSLDLRGSLEHVWYGHDDNTYSGLLKEVVEQPEERRVLYNIFNSAVPLLTAPLYIGISRNVQGRLLTHKKLMRSYQEKTAEAESALKAVVPVDDPEALRQDMNFARRVIERGIDPSHLVVGVIYVDQRRVPQQRVRRAIEAAETLLNRIFHPILGRR